MIESTITKATAKAIYKSKFVLLIPSMIVGLILGFLKESDILLKNNLLIFSIVLSVSLLLILLSLLLGIKIGMRKLIDTKFILNEDQLIKEKQRNKIKINVSEIKKLTENWVGLTVSATSGKIIIPKQIDNYENFTEELRNSIEIQKKLSAQ